MTIEERVRSLVADVLGAPLASISAQSSHENVQGWDSMAMINLMMAVEAEFGVQLTVEDATGLDSVQAIIKVIQDRGAA